MLSTQFADGVFADPADVEPHGRDAAPGQAPREHDREPAVADVVVRAGVDDQHERPAPRARRRFAEHAEQFALGRTVDALDAQRRLARLAREDAAGSGSTRAEKRRSGIPTWAQSAR
ncbi:MAG: hypothetical protein WDN30_08730 [Pararobbsia sp.]